ncbi:MAG: response regulator [Lentisphaeraceae bacterium]|nr:response regulator [Lentisphaeraceae bacterium]
MKVQEQTEEKILVVASDNDFRNGMRGMLESAGYSVFTRQSVERSMQLLELSDIFLVVTDYELEDGTFFDFIKTLRNSNTFYNETPIYCIGNDKNPDECISAFDAGADDYSLKPLNKKIFLARVKKIITAVKKLRYNPVSLELRVDQGELPGVFQFLEAETKNGILKASCQKDMAEITFKSGKIVKAETEYCAAQDALTEVLSWPFCHLKFIDDSIEGEFDINLNVSSTLMDCVFEVDEFKETLGKYPDMEVSFVGGENPLPKNSNRIAKKVHRMASSGSTFDELINSIKINRRHLITLVDQLVSMGHLQQAVLPFENYLADQKNYLQDKNIFPKTLPSIIDAVETMNYTDVKELETLTISNSDSDTSATPKILIAGDHTELNDILFSTIHKIAANSYGNKSPVKSSRTNEAHTKLEFFNNSSLVLQKLPPKVDSIFLKTVMSQEANIASIFFIASALDKETSRACRKILKQLRDNYKGTFYIILPKLDSEEPEMRIDCPYCSHKLSVDIDMSGSLGNCPICNTEITIPECLDYSADSLKLLPEVPCVFINPIDPEECRDLISLSLNSLLEEIAT